jgi:hypothetical protein
MERAIEIRCDQDAITVDWSNSTFYGEFRTFRVMLRPVLAAELKAMELSELSAERAAPAAVSPTAATLLDARNKLPSADARAHEGSETEIYCGTDLSCEANGLVPGQRYSVRIDAVLWTGHRQRKVAFGKPVVVRMAPGLYIVYSCTMLTIYLLTILAIHYTRYTLYSQYTMRHTIHYAPHHTLGSNGTVVSRSP